MNKGLGSNHEFRTSVARLAERPTPIWLPRLLKPDHETRRRRTRKAAVRRIAPRNVTGILKVQRGVAKGSGFDLKDAEVGMVLKALSPPWPYIPPHPRRRELHRERILKQLARAGGRGARGFRRCAALPVENGHRTDRVAGL